MGTVDTIPSNLGNLGDGYVYPLTKLYIQKAESQNATLIPLDDVFAQRIAILPGDYFQNVLGIHTPAGFFNPQPTIIDHPSDPYAASRENLQLRTFVLPTPRPTSTPVPTLPVPPTNTPPPPVVQPTIPPDDPVDFTDSCTELAIQQCQAAGISLGGPGFIECLLTNRAKNRATIDTKDAVCRRSPLYLYGQDGQKVSVKIQTPIYNDKPKYTDGYNVKLLTDGKMEINKNIFEAINYDYRSNLRMVRPPTSGIITSASGIEKVIREYGKKLGLNEKETTNLVKFGKEKVKSSYVFISFFGQEVSEQILPLSFTPKPDNYLNVVFYFKQLAAKPNYTPVPPEFPTPLQRSGFTAVEVSEIVE